MMHYADVFIQINPKAAGRAVGILAVDLGDQNPVPFGLGVAPFPRYTGPPSFNRRR